MARRIGLVLAFLAGCAGGEDSPRDLVSELSVESVAAVPSGRVLAVSMAGLDERTFVVARATTQGTDFCPACLDPNALDCAATCRRAVIEVTRYRADAPADPPQRFHEAFPLLSTFDVEALDIVALDETHVGVGWLECDRATCGESTPRRSCTARYAAVDMITGRHAPVATFYEDWYGDLQLSFDRGSRQLLALLGKQRASGVGVRAAIYDEQGAVAISPWQTYGGAAASAPVPVAAADGFLIAAADPAPSVPGAAEPCSEACDCQLQGVPELATGGLYAFRPGLGVAPERIAAGRMADGVYEAPPAIAAVAAAGRVIVASSQRGDGATEVFEPVGGGWTSRYSTQAPAPRWLGALADATHLAWIGFDEDSGPSGTQRLVAGVAAGERSQRGEIGEVAPGDVIRVAPVSDGDAVRTTYLLRSVLSAGGSGAPPERFEVLAVHARW
jgi:hypothetical protein